MGTSSGLETQVPPGACDWCLESGCRAGLSTWGVSCRPEWSCVLRCPAGVRGLCGVVGEESPPHAHTLELGLGARKELIVLVENA